MIALARKREHALVRLVGATQRQVVQAARWEAALVVLVGVGLGTAIALAALIPFSKAVTGSPVPYMTTVPGRRHRRGDHRSWLRGKPRAYATGTPGASGRSDRARD